MASPWYNDTYTWFGTLLIDGGYIPYYPLFWEWTGVRTGDYARIQYSLDLGSHTNLESDTIAARLFEGLGILEDRDDAEDDEQTVFFEEDISLEPLDDSNNVVKRIIPYLPHTKIKIWTRNANTHPDGDTGWVTWHHMPIDFDQIGGSTVAHADGCHDTYYADSGNPCWDISGSGDKGLPAARFFVKMKYNIDNKKSIHVHHDSNHSAGAPETLTVDVVDTEDMSASFGSILTLQFNTLLIKDLCLWCFMLEVDYEGTNTIAECNLEANNYSDCTEAQLHNICSSEEALQFEICQDYCKRSNGNCYEAILDLCASTEYDQQESVAYTYFDKDVHDIRQLYCGCYLSQYAYTDWYNTEIINRELETENGIDPDEERCLFGQCLESTYKFDGWSNCKDVTFCSNRIDADTIDMSDYANIIMINNCDEDGVNDNSTDDAIITIGNVKEEKTLWEQFMDIDFLGEYTPYIIIGIFGLIFCIVIYLGATGGGTDKDVLKRLAELETYDKTI